MNLVSLAQTLTLAWRIESEAEALFSRAQLRSAILVGLQQMPDKIRSLLHIQDRLTGDAIREEASIIGAAALSGLLDPSRTTVTMDMLDSIDRMKNFQLYWPVETKWCRDVIRGQLGLVVQGEVNASDRSPLPL